MTGGQNTQITMVTAQTLTIPNTSNTGITILDVGEKLITAPMHVAMSNVYDQFRIRKVTMKISPTKALTSVNDPSYYTLFTTFDRNGFTGVASLPVLQTYASYKQTSYSGDSSNRAPVHYVSWENNTLFEKSRYFSTKKKPVAGFVFMGNYVPVNPTGELTPSYSISWSFDITYRGLRADASAIVDTVGDPE